MKSDKDLLHDIEAMAPWHHGVLLRDSIFTTATKTTDAAGGTVHHYNADNAFQNATKTVFPRGMEGRSFLDCACNCGGYSFAAKDHGAGMVYGFDIRKHWIDQAHFVMENREADSSDMSFEIGNLMSLESHENEYDVTWFSGIFYHLPDPITGLKLAADKTKELLFLNTACLPQIPDIPEVPALQYKLEGTEQLMSGIYGPSWLPSGPIVLTNILNWLGFPDVKVYFWIESNAEDFGRSKRGRIGVVAAREKGRLDDLKAKPQPSLLDFGKF